MRFYSLSRKLSQLRSSADILENLKLKSSFTFFHINTVWGNGRRDLSTPSTLSHFLPPPLPPSGGSRKQQDLFHKDTRPWNLVQLSFYSFIILKFYIFSTYSVHWLTRYICWKTYWYTYVFILHINLWNTDCVNYCIYFSVHCD